MVKRKIRKYAYRWKNPIFIFKSLIAKQRFILKNWPLRSNVIIVNLKAYLTKIKHSQGKTATDRSSGIDNEDIIKDVSLQTFILQGEVAENPDDEDIPVAETFWRLPEVLYFDRHICQSFWGMQRYQNWRGQKKNEEIIFFSLG